MDSNQENQSGAQKPKGFPVRLPKEVTEEEVLALIRKGQMERMEKLAGKEELTA